MWFSRCSQRDHSHQTSAALSRVEHLTKENAYSRFGYRMTATFRFNSRPANGSSQQSPSLPSGRELCALTGHTSFVNAVAVTPNGQRAVSASSDHTLRVWDLGGGRELRTLTGHTKPVSAVAVTPDGQRAVSASSDRTPKVWDR
jgi:WD40 repeat protein